MDFCMHCMSPIEKSDSECPFCGKAFDEVIPAHHLKPGTILNKKFLVGAALGEGGFGITYIGRDLTLDIKVAIKEYYPNGYVNRSNTVSPDVTCSTTSNRKDFFNSGREKFLKEARILAKFSGEPGVVDVRDFFEENNTAYIVMEYLDGQDLKEYLKENGTMSAEQTIKMLMPLMKALIKIHGQGLIHRDISPDNIRLVGENVKLMDFGAARDVSANANKSLSVMLKPGYAPEEQYRSKGVQGPWTDVYALCATIYKCITGITPDDSTQRVFSDELKTPTALGITINETLELALMKGLSVLQKDRYQSIDELINGFKGINKTINSDEKTVYQGREVTEDDTETRYLNEDSEDETATQYLSENEDDSVTQANPTNEEKTSSGESVPPAKKIDTTETPTIKKETPIIPKSEVKDSANAKEKKPRSKKKIGIIALAAILGIVAIVAISTMFNALNNITISGEKVSKNEDSLYLYDKTLTVDDMKAIVSLGKLESLRFSGCTFDDSTIKYVGDIASVLKTISFDSCTGIDDFTFLSNLKYLTDISIIDSGLKNEHLKEVDFSNKDYLTSVDLSKNPDFSDISKLSEIDTLTQIAVSETSVKDFSALKDCEALYNVEANGNGIENLNSLTNKTIAYLYVDNNAINDISALKNFEYLSNFYANKNKITDISALADHKALYHIELSENQITDISALATCERLSWLQLSDNSVADLSPLSGCKELGYLYVNRNQLVNLKGLENALELKVIQATENKINDISGLTNCTIIEEANFNANSISDISLLGKSAKKLEKVFFNNNNVSDISCLKGTSALQYLSFDFNNVTTLDALTDSVSLLAISAEGNELTSMDGLSNSVKLKYIYLPHNKIESMYPISQLAPRAENDFAVIDLSSNNITSLSLTADKAYTYLAVYNNPITALDTFTEAKGTYVLFSHVEGTDYAAFSENFRYFKVVDCPLDKQVGVKTAIDGEGSFTISSVQFQTTEEADQATKDAKSVILTGSTAPTEEE